MSTDSDAPNQNPNIRQDVTGDRNQVIAQMLGGTAIANVENLNQITQMPRSPESARYSLPPDAPEFTGREDEIQQIEADVSAGWIVAIAGMAGVGKSALAVRVAHRLREQYPGGQIYLDLRGANQQPLSVDSALDSLLRALGVDPAQIPPEQADKVALYRSKLAQTSTLVLLDNVADVQQVIELLPASTSGAGACLSTSRRQLDGLTGVKHCNLEALSEAEAVELFQKVLPPERVQAEIEAARQIVSYCGRLPLAVRIAAATLGMRSWQGKRLAAYTQQLADERQRLDRLKLENLDVQASFELSYRELNPAAQTLLAWLGLLPADFGTEILKSLTQEPTEQVQETLAELVDGRLVDPYTLSTGERYVLHNLMRLFAQEKLTDQAAVIAAKVRLVQWCGEQANTYEGAIDPIKRRQRAEILAITLEENERTAPSVEDLEVRLLQQALAWFEAERQTLVRSFDWAVETQQRRESVALAVNLASFFSLRGYWTDSLTTHQRALSAAQEIEDVQGAGGILNNLGTVYQAQGKWRNATSCYKQSLEICQRTRDVQGQGRTLNNLGNIYKDQSNWNEALICYEQALEAFQRIGDTQGEGGSLNNIGLVYKAQGRWSEAIDYYEQSLRIRRRIGDVQGEASSINNLGNIYKDQGKWNNAVECYEQALESFRCIGDIQGEASSLSNLGLVYKAQGNWSDAINCYKQSLKINRHIGSIQGEASSLSNLGLVYKAQGNWSDAINCYKQSLKISRHIGSIQGEAGSLNNLGNTYKDQGKWDEAIDCYEQCLETFQHVGDIQGEAGSFNNLGLIYQAQGQWSDAINCYEQSLKIKRCIGDIRGEATTLNNLGLVYQDQEGWSDAINCYQKCLEICWHIEDVQGESQALNNLGLVYKSQGKWSDAISCYQKSLDIKRRIGDIHGEGQTLTNLGSVYQAQGESNDASNYYQKSLEILQRIGDTHGEGKILANLGILCELQKQLDQAIALWQNALTKLHPNSPEYATVNRWIQSANQPHFSQDSITDRQEIQSANQPRRPQWLGWLLALGILLFLVWNLLKGYWWIALLIALPFLIRQWFRRRR